MAGAIAATLGASGLALADDAASPVSFTGNVGLYSQYVFRGLTQSREKPAVQGGFDYAYNFGPASFYLGTWGSNISWLSDFGTYASSSLEWDWYGGFRGNFGSSDFTYDVGFLYYYYPGTVNPGANSGDTQEIYGALGWKWITAKYSYSVGNKTFAVDDTSGTWYLDLSASVPFGDTGLTGFAHWGDQKYSGTAAFLVGSGIDNDNLFSYEDWKIGLSYDLSKLSKTLSGTTIGTYYTDTDANPLGYTDLGGKNIGDSQWVVYLQKSL